MSTEQTVSQQGFPAPTTPRKRTAWIWVIFLWFLVSVAWTLLSFWLVRSGALPLEPAQKAYFDSLTVVDYASTIVVALLNLAGALMLFMLRKAALPLFLASIALSAVILVGQAVSRGWIEAAGGSGLIGTAIGYALIGAICLYTWRLTRRGVLQ